MEDRNDRSAEQKRQDEYMRGGKGRKDEVGGSGIYPASDPNAPADAEVRSEGGLVSHKGPRQKPADEQSPKNADRSSGSE
jgi:hypothetical protein